MPNHEHIYQHEADAYEQLIAAQPSLTDVIREIRSFANLDVVDLGAGTGRFSQCLAAEAKSLIATDSSEAMLDVLDKKLSKTAQGASVNWRTVAADHRSVPLDNGIADLVVSGWSICYVASVNVAGWEANLAKVMDQIHRMLKKDGTIIIFETLGTGFEQPDPPSFLLPYYNLLESQYGFSHKAIRTDYHFKSVDEAKQLTGFFFGHELAAKVADHNWTVVPEYAGVWWKHT